MIGRRTFLKWFAVGLAIGVISPSRLSLGARFANPHLFDVFEMYSELVGLRSTARLNSSSQAQNERQRVNRLMAESNFNRGANGRQYTDLRNVSDLPRYRKPAHAESYIVGNANRIDICAPFYANYVSGESKPIFESAQLLGATAAAVQLSADNFTQQEIADILLPIAATTNPGLQAYVSSPYRTLGEYETTNGSLSALYTPNATYGNAVVEVEARGEINFTDAYEFFPSYIPTFA